MKLLGWMHRKLRQNGSDPLKDFAIGSSCNSLSGQPLVDEQYHYTKPNYGTTLRPSHRDNLRKSFTGLETARVEELYEEESSAALSELFHGFLAIGTLGSDPIMNDPSTPTFSISIENITEKSTEITENELKLINVELEKVLGAEAKENGCNDSSRKNSYVSNGRSSHGSSIAFSSKRVDGTDTNGNGTTVCPLQGYLFGSAIELSETTVVEKKEHRTSLGELFQRSKIAEENFGTKCEREENRTEKETDKSAVHLKKKMLKKKLIHSSSRSSNAAAGGPVDSASAENKLHKILQMFHRKVHPENSTAEQNPDKTQKDENKKNISPDGKHNNCQMLQDEDVIIYPRKALSERTIRCYQSQSNPPQFTLNGSDSNGNREYWVKTDANYLVLEL